MHDGLAREESIALLRKRANGYADLLARAAGHYLGMFLAHGAASPNGVEFAARLIAAGADLGQVPGFTDEARAALRAAGY